MAIRAGAALLGGLGGGSLGTLFLTLSANPAGLISGMKQAVTSVDGGGKKILASAAKIGAGIAVALGVAAVKAAGDFEESFAGVRKTVDATEQEFRKLEGAFRDMAKQIPANVNEINKVAEAAGQLGIKNENLVGFTKVMIDLGNTTNLSSDQAASSLARLANITQMPQENFDRLGATIVDLGNNLATTEAEIVDMALRLAGAGHQVGMTEADIVSFAAALSSVGIRAEEGGTAVSQAMIKMAEAVGAGSEELEIFARTAGLSVGDFTHLFQTDATQAILKFVNGLSDMKKRGDDVFGTLEQLKLDGIRMTDVMLRLSGAGDLVNKSLTIGNRAWEQNTALVDEAEKRYTTFYSQLKITWNQINDILITIGTELIPAVKALNEVIKESIGGFDGVNKSNNSWVKDVAPAFIATVGTIGDAFNGLLVIVTSLKIAYLEVAKAGAAMGAIGQSGINPHFAELSKEADEATASLDRLLNGPSFSDRITQKLANLNRDTKTEAEKFGFNIDTMIKKFDEVDKKAAKSVIGSALVGTPKTSIGAATKTIDEMFKRTFGEGAKPGEAHVLGALPGEDPAGQHLKEMQAQQKNATDHLSELQRISDQEVALTAATEQKKLDLIKAYNEELRALQLAQAQIVLNSASSIFGDLAGITESFGARQSGIYKAMFAASKAFAIAEATVKIAQGIASAASLGFPAGIVGIAQVVAATASIISNIQSVQLEFGGGKAAGGSVTPGKAFMVGERGPELFSPSSAGNITPNNALGGRVNIVVNNFTDAQAEVRTTENGDEKTVEIIIARTKNSIATDIRQGTGDVNKSLQSSFGLKRAGR